MKLTTALLGLLPAASALVARDSDAVELRDPAPAIDVPSEEHFVQKAKSKGFHLCFILPDRHGGDDGAVIQDALNNRCNSNSLVVLPGPLYHIKTPMKTMGLKNVLIEQFGRLQWSDDIDYWLSVSMPVGFQNQSTVWYFGGDNIHWNGHGVGTFDGNGQAWYDFTCGQGNYPRRPMAINWRELTNSEIHGLRFVQPQMWTMATSSSKNLLFEDIYVNATSNSDCSTLNTDGIDTIDSSDITLRRWKVDNGDDCVALKRNSTNIQVYDSEFWSGQGIAIGSMGQYDGKFEYLDNFYARNITMHDTHYAMYMKTWAGTVKGYPPNGGGGGIGHARNIVIEDIVMDLARGQIFWMEQGENYEGDQGKNRNTSKFKMYDVILRNISGTSVADNEDAAILQCSEAAGGCSNITITNFSVRPEGSDDILSTYQCENVHENHGFKCSPYTEG